MNPCSRARKLRLDPLEVRDFAAIAASSKRFTRSRSKAKAVIWDRSLAAWPAACSEAKLDQAEVPRRPRSQVPSAARLPEVKSRKELRKPGISKSLSDSKTVARIPLRIRL